VVTRRVSLLLCALALAGALASRLAAQPASLPEYQIKALFLFNFAQFVEWPATAFASEEAPLVICVVGNDPFGGTLDQAVEGESIRKRKLIVRRSGIDDRLSTCHLLFVGKSEAAQINRVLQAIGSGPVLVVSDIHDFVELGGTIGFFIERNRVRFEISPSQAQRHGLKLSSQLLGLGRIRESDPRGGAP
jgi:hypothetical protein